MILVLLLLLLLMLALYDVLRVFFGVLTFALIFSVSFHGPYERLVRLLGNRRSLGSLLYSILLIAVIALPVTYIVSEVRGHIREAIACAMLSSGMAASLKPASTTERGMP